MNTNIFVTGPVLFLLHTPMSASSDDQPFRFAGGHVPAVFDAPEPATGSWSSKANDTSKTPSVSVRESDAVRIAGKNPGLLVKWLHERSLPDWGVATVCDVLGRECVDTGLVLDALAPVLDHPKAYVREAAVLGLRNHIDSLDVQKVLRDTLESESASEVKLAIESALRLA